MAFDLATTVQPYTMATRERIELVMELCQRANAENIPGDFVECGCCNGGLSAVLAHYGIGRTTWLFDSFQGLPSCGPNDSASANGNDPHSEIGKCVGSFAKVAEAINLTTGVDGYNWPNVQFVGGWFADTFPRVTIPKIAFLLLDSDWYSSELLCWQKFYDCVVPGGFIYIDDYFYWPGAQKAANDFLVERGKGIAHLIGVGHSAWMVKR